MLDLPIKKRRSLFGKFNFSEIIVYFRLQKIKIKRIIDTYTGRGCYLMKQKFDVVGMTCSACSAHVEKAVSKLKGVTNVNVSLLTNSMTVEFDEKATNTKAIISAVKKSGYGASVNGETERSFKQTATNNVGIARLIVSVVFCVILMYFSMGHMVGIPLPSFLDGHANAVSLALVQFLICLPIWYANRSYFIVGFKRLFQRAPNMDSLIAVGATASALYALAVTFVMSYALGKGDMDTVAKYHHMLYFESSAMILTLVDLGKYFEGRSKLKTGDALAKLRKLAPDKAILIEDEQEREVDSKTIKAGDVVAIKAGMSFPADGKVVFGNCFADESSVSGESIPVEKQSGAFVIGGTVCVGGYVRVEVTTVGQDSVLEKIISLVEEAGTSKAPIQRLADKISAVFVPIVMSISLVTFVVWLCVGYPISTALNFAVSVLVISCPCALGLATPVAIMVATGKGAENGILVKNGEILERLAQIKQVVLDKTGTLTLGKPYVKEYISAMDGKEFFSLVGGIEKQSEHPLGKAVVEHADKLGAECCVPTQFETLPGRGVVATVDGKVYAVGNARLMQEQGVKENYDEQLDSFSKKALTCLIVACNGEFIGMIGVGDEIKASSKDAVNMLKSMNIKPILLTGDNETAAKAVCEAVGIDEFYAEVLPDQKEQKVRSLMNDGVTAMVGDGINDAPALARADIGFAVTNGADIAMDSADVLLVKNDIRDVSTAISLSKKTVINIKENLFWAFFYNLLGIPIACGVLYVTPLHWQLSPMIGALAMSLSSLFVVTNALRLRFFKPNLSCADQDKKIGSTKNKTEVKTMKYKLTIQGMMCEHCTARVKQALSSMRGVLNVSVDLENKCAVAETKKQVNAEAFKKAVEKVGYTVTEVQQL